MSNMFNVEQANSWLGAKKLGGWKIYPKSADADKIQELQEKALQQPRDPKHFAQEPAHNVLPKNDVYAFEDEHGQPVVFVIATGNSENIEMNNVLGCETSGAVQPQYREAVRALAQTDNDFNLKMEEAAKKVVQQEGLENVNDKLLVQTFLPPQDSIDNSPLITVGGYGSGILSAAVSGMHTEKEKTVKEEKIEEQQQDEEDQTQLRAMRNAIKKQEAKQFTKAAAEAAEEAAEQEIEDEAMEAAMAEAEQMAADGKEVPADFVLKRAKYFREMADTEKLDKRKEELKKTYEEREIESYQDDAYERYQKLLLEHGGNKKIAMQAYDKEVFNQLSLTTIVKENLVMNRDQIALVLESIESEGERGKGAFPVTYAMTEETFTQIEEYLNHPQNSNCGIQRGERYLKLRDFTLSFKQELDTQLEQDGHLPEPQQSEQVNHGSTVSRPVEFKKGIKRIVKDDQIHTN